MSNYSENPQYTFEDYEHLELLTKKEAYDLMRKVQEGYEARDILSEKDTTSKEENEISNEKSENIQEEKDLVKLAEIGQEAWKKLCLHNEGLLIKVAKSYVSFLPLEHLKQVGTLGILRAALKFDFKKNVEFSTYATWWIRQAMSREVNIFYRNIRVPGHIFPIINKLREAEVELVQKHFRYPTIEELAEFTDLAVDEVKFVVEASLEPVSLNKTIFKDGDSAELGEFIDGDSDTEKEGDMNLLTEILADAVHALDGGDSRHRIILERRFGLITGEGETLREVGAYMKLSRERVRQLENEALERLRLKLKGNKNLLDQFK